MRISIHYATNVSEILNNRSPPHSDSNDLRNFEPLTSSSGLGKVRIGLLEQFRVIFAQFLPALNSMMNHIFVDSLFDYSYGETPQPL